MKRDIKEARETNREIFTDVETFRMVHKISKLLFDNCITYDQMVEIFNIISLYTMNRIEIESASREEDYRLEHDVDDDDDLDYDDIDEEDLDWILPVDTGSFIVPIIG